MSCLVRETKCFCITITLHMFKIILYICSIVIKVEDSTLKIILGVYYLIILLTISTFHSSWQILDNAC